MGFWNSTPVKKTRKTHRCMGCLEMIPKGSPASKEVGTHEGDLQSFYLCIPCETFIKDSEIREYAEGDIGQARKQAERG